MCGLNKFGAHQQIMSLSPKINASDHMAQHACERRDLIVASHPVQHCVCCGSKLNKHTLTGLYLGIGNLESLVPQGPSPKILGSPKNIWGPHRDNPIPKAIFWLLNLNVNGSNKLFLQFFKNTVSSAGYI